jgi:plastocyanin
VSTGFTFSYIRRIAVALALAFGAASAAGCGGDNLSPTNPDNPTLVTIFIKNSSYSPNPATVKVGQQVNFKNDDNIEHSATTTSGPVTFESGNIPPNSAKNIPVTMSATGTVNFRCRLHGETGSINVVN